jgi:hypothetical protein
MVSFTSWNHIMKIMQKFIGGAVRVKSVMSEQEQYS